MIPASHILITVTTEKKVHSVGRVITLGKITERLEMFLVLTTAQIVIR